MSNTKARDEFNKAVVNELQYILTEVGEVDPEHAIEEATTVIFATNSIRNLLFGDKEA